MTKEDLSKAVASAVADLQPSDFVQVHKVGVNTWDVYRLNHHPSKAYVALRVTLDDQVLVGAVNKSIEGLKTNLLGESN